VAALRGNFTGKPPLEQRFDGERNEGKQRQKRGNREGGTI
jgi:hypothetical protein